MTSFLSAQFGHLHPKFLLLMFQLNPTLTHPLWTCRIGDSIGLEAYLDVDDVGLAVGLPTLCGQLMSWRVDWVPYLVFDRDEHEWNF